MKQEVLIHFRRVDPTLFSVLAKIPNKEHFVPVTSRDLFSDLVETIICQQLSDKAGATIFGRFQKLFTPGKVTPERVLEFSDETIRGVGTSRSKVGFIKNLAQHVLTKSVQLAQLAKLPDQEVIRELTKLKGIGPWTAEMFLMFSLGREDIFSYGDLGLRNAIKKLYGLKKDPTKKQMESLTRKWSPYRTYAARILWRSLEL